MADSKKRPTHRMYAIFERGGKDDSNYWVEIGAGWENSDGSINCRQNLTPNDPDVTIQLRSIDDDKDG